MSKNVLIVATTEGFMIKGLETKLKGIGAESVYAHPNLKDIGDKCQNAATIIIFTDDKVGEMADALVYLKDYCSGNAMQLFVIGKKEEYEVLKDYLPERLVQQFYERPLDMDLFITDMEKVMEDETKIARRRTILIVDDDVSYMSMIMDWLKDTYRISMANSGMEAITWLAKNKADLILLDYEMPITTGPQVLEMLRSDPDMEKIPVMFLTGKGDKESVMKVLSLKPAGYLLKTVEKKELRDTLANFFATEAGSV